MSNRLENSNATEKPTVYGSIGLAIFLICFGVYYLIPNMFPEGTLFIVAGVLILLVNIAKLFKSIGYNGLEILFGIAFLVSGINKVLRLEIGFVPAIFIVLGVFYLFKSINKLINGQIFN